MNIILKIAFVSFGCKVNQSEINNMISELASYDVIYEKKPEFADILIVNTCAVTQKAQKDGEKYLKSIRRKNNNLRIIATGCLAELVKNNLTDVDLIVSNKDKTDLIKNLNLPARKDPKKVRTHTRAFVKIHDGCDCYCSYCIIPFLRGNPVSVNSTDVMMQVQNYINDGYKEIVLTGIHIGMYHDGNDSLIDLLKKLVSLSSDYRIRLTSLYVNEITDDLINFISDSNGKITPHFHISLQSASDKILKLMNRKYHVKDFTDTVAKIRSKLPDAFIGVDIITGFPGETEIDFQEGVDVLNNMPVKYMLDSMHIFPFSPRPGTAAADFQNQITDDAKTLRAGLLADIAYIHKKHRTELMNGKKFKVLAEKGFKGHTDNYYLVNLPQECVQGTFYDVTLIIQNGELYGKID